LRRLSICSIRMFMFVADFAQIEYGQMGEQYYGHKFFKFFKWTKTQATLPKLLGFISKIKA
jgi:hypothetical protein